MWDNELDKRYNLIYRYFKTTNELYHDLEWDGETLRVWLDDTPIETYTLKDLIEIIPNF